MSTRSKYYRVRNSDVQGEIPSHHIIMKTSFSYGKYVARAYHLFFGDDVQTVVIKASQTLIEKALWVAKKIKDSVEGIHQITSIEQRKVTDIYEPKEEGLVRVEVINYLTNIEIVLTKEVTEEQRASPGYCPPLKVDERRYITKKQWQEKQIEKNQKYQKEDHKDQRDHQDYRDQRNQRDHRDHRDHRDYKDQRDFRQHRQLRQQKQNRENQNYRDHKDHKDHRDQREYRDYRDQKNERQKKDERYNDRQNNFNNRGLQKRRGLKRE